MAVSQPVSPDGDEGAAVLVVDDNASKRLALIAALAPLGHPVVEADSGRAALRCVIERDFAVILMDVRMPPMDGYETVELIRGRDRSESTPVIFVTANASEEIDKTKGYASGAVDFIFAPVNPTVLRAKVAVFVELFRKTRALEHEIHLSKLAAREKAGLQASLARAQKLETVGNFAGRIAHDFNNILAIILNYSEFAAEAMEDHPAKADIQEIRAAAERAARLTQQLLVFSRHDIAKVKPMDLDEVILALDATVKSTLGPAIELVMALGGDDLIVEADESHLEQVLLSLVANARDAMPDGGTLEIETDRVCVRDPNTLGGPEGLDAGSYARLRLTDSGVGMSEEVQGRLSEPFFSTKPAGVSTGLGLATIYRIVQDAGGATHVSSEPGHGACFEVYWPHAEYTRSESGIHLLPTSAPDGQTILLVDDEQGVRDVATRILTNVGYRVRQTGDQREATRWIESQAEEFDVLLTDIIMPAGSGIALAARFAELLPDAPVVFMSGYPDRPQALPDDARFLAKPFDSAELLRTVAMALAAPPTRAQPAHPSAVGAA